MSYDSWKSTPPDMGEQICEHVRPECGHVTTEHLASEMSCEEADRRQPECPVCFEWMCNIEDGLFIAADLEIQVKAAFENSSKKEQNDVK